MDSGLDQSNLTFVPKVLYGTTSIRGDIPTITPTIQASIFVLKAKALALSNSMAQVKVAASE